MLIRFFFVDLTVCLSVFLFFFVFNLSLIIFPFKINHHSGEVYSHKAFVANLL